MSQITELTDADFESNVLSASTPTLVDFWAPWCQPCKALAPILEDLAPNYQGKLDFAKINVDEHKETAAKYGVRGIPTLMIFSNGEMVASKIGALDKKQLNAFISEHV